MLSLPPWLLLQMNGTAASIGELLVNLLIFTPKARFRTLKYRARMYHIPQYEGDEYRCSVENVIIHLISLLRAIGTPSEFDDAIKNASTQEGD